MQRSPRLLSVGILAGAPSGRRQWPAERRKRRPRRFIVDYTFSSLNGETVPVVPRKAVQFGRALQRVFSRMVHADPRYGPVYMEQIEIADGFYRVWLNAMDVPKLGFVLPPRAPGCVPLVAFPLALPMGWVESLLFHGSHGDRV